MTDDSNGESTFEFVERKTDESSASGEIVKTGKNKVQNINTCVICQSLLQRKKSLRLHSSPTAIFRKAIEKI